MACACLGASIGLGCGVALYTPVSSLFFRALEQEFHWSKAASAASLIALPATALSLPFIGRLIERFGVVAVALGSALCLSAGLFALSMMSGALAQFYVLVLMMNVLGAGTGPISYTRVIANDFRAARGLALALALLGVAVVGVIVPILVTHAIAAGGWRKAYRVLSLVTLVGGGLAVLLVRSRRTSVPKIDGHLLPGLTLGDALRSPAFWLLGFSVFFISVAAFGFTSQLQSIGVEKGLTPTTAALLISLLALSVMPTRLLVGWALDKVDPRFAAAAALVLAAIGAAVVLFAPHSSLLLVALGVVLLGGSIGAELDLMSFFCAYCFGMKNFASIYGTLAGFFYIGIAAGGVGYGATHDRTGSYLLALSVSVGVLALASVLLLALPKRPLETELTCE